MNLSEFKSHLKTLETLEFRLPDGSLVPAHFHLTEIGLIDKVFIDCGGTLRQEKKISFQLWYSTDVEHRLSPKRLLEIVEMGESKLNLGNAEIEIEYQSETIGKYGLELGEASFKLISTQTDCLAPDKCNIPEKSTANDLTGLIMNQNSCTPGSGCC